MNVSESQSHTYGDNGVFSVTVTAIDDDGGTSQRVYNVTVNNVKPIIESLEAYMYVNLSLRVAGEKWHSVGIKLLEDESEVWVANVTRYPGNPDEQTAEITGVKLDLTKSYSILVDYLPNDPRINGNVWGANPVWIDCDFDDGPSKRLHHTFNVRQSYWDSDHWNHIDPWEVPFSTILVGHNITMEASASDVGSDDLSFSWDFGDGAAAGPNIYYNNGLSPDPYPSPQINPMSAFDEVVYAYSVSGDFIITLSVEDDDGGWISESIIIILSG
jgi:hypothetical protein